METEIVSIKDMVNVNAEHLQHIFLVKQIPECIPTGY